MFIAHTKVSTFEGEEVVKVQDITYGVKVHAPSELIDLLNKYMKAYNRLNPNNKIQIQLLSVSDLSQSVHFRLVQDLGIVELTREQFYAMRDKISEQLKKENPSIPISYSTSNTLPSEFSDEAKSDDQRTTESSNEISKESFYPSANDGVVGD